MKMNQIAFYCATDEQADLVKRKFGLQDAVWSHDTVTAEVRVWRDRDMVPWVGKNVAALQFNEDMGIQLELIRYTEGLHWCMYHPAYDINGVETYIAHVGIHIGEHDWPPHLNDVKLVQQAMTRHHAAFNDRTYEYRIYEFAPGSYVKYIKRIPA